MDLGGEVNSSNIRLLPLLSLLPPPLSSLCLLKGITFGLPGERQVSQLLDVKCVSFPHLLGTRKRFTSRQRAESINNFGRKYNFVHKIQFRARAYQNTLRPWNFLNICKCQGLCETTDGNIFSQLIQNPIHPQ